MITNKEDLLYVINTKVIKKLGRKAIKSITISAHHRFVVDFYNRKENFCDFWVLKSHLLNVYNIKENTNEDIEEDVIDNNEVYHSPVKENIMEKLIDKSNEIISQNATESMKEFLFEEFLFENSHLIAEEKPVVLVEKFRRYVELSSNSSEMLKKFTILLEDFLH